MLTKGLLAATLVLLTVLLVVYVYPSHPYAVWALLGICWASYRLGLRARSFFGPKASKAQAIAPSWDSIGQNSRNPDRLLKS